MKKKRLLDHFIDLRNIMSNAATLCSTLVIEEQERMRQEQPLNTEAVNDLPPPCEVGGACIDGEACDLTGRCIEETLHRISYGVDEMCVITIAGKNFEVKGMSYTHPGTLSFDDPEQVITWLQETSPPPTGSKIIMLSEESPCDQYGNEVNECGQSIEEQVEQLYSDAMEMALEMACNMAAELMLNKNCEFDNQTIANRTLTQGRMLIAEDIRQRFNAKTLPLSKPVVLETLERLLSETGHSIRNEDTFAEVLKANQPSKNGCTK